MPSPPRAPVPPRLRPATAADLLGIAALHAANWRGAYAGAVPASAFDAPLHAFMAETWGDPGVLGALEITVAETARGLAGFVAAGARPEGWLIVNLHVAEGARGQGLGRRLFETARAGAARRGLAPWLEVLEANGAARAAYRAWGGTEGAPFADTLLGHPVTAVPVRWPAEAAAPGAKSALGD